MIIINDFKKEEFLKNWIDIECWKLVQIKKIEI